MPCKVTRTLIESIRRDDGTTLIPLSQELFAVIDTCDFDLIKDHTWHAHAKINTTYAETHVRTPEGKRVKVGIHRMLLPTEMPFIDHKDGNGLNNRRSNLRPCTRVQNSRNHTGHRDRRSGISERGVYWHKRKKRWYAMVKHDGKNRHIGMFKTEAEAVEARKLAELAIDAEFFPAGNSND